MKKLQPSPSPVIPEAPDHPDWPEPREERCRRYGEWYALFWKLRVIRRAQRFKQLDAARRRTRS